MTIKEIKKIMTDAFLTDPTLKNAYGIKDGATWDSTFSSVSIENILIYIVAACHYVLYKAFDAHKVDIDALIAANIVPTTRWYHTKCLGFQYGDELIFDEATQSYRYQTVDETKQIIKYAAVRDAGNTIDILVAKDSGGKPAILNATELKAFSSYMSQIKIAGVLLNIQSLPADSIQIEAVITVDPQIITTSGVRISDGAKPVEDAINQYLAGIVYGGTFNKTKCVDAIQAVSGVIDIDLKGVKAKSSTDLSYKDVTTNNYNAVAGCLVSNNLNTSLSYVV